MQYKEDSNSKKNNRRLFLLVICFVIIIVLAVACVYAWAKYSTLVTGNATEQVAKWYFNLNEGTSQTTGDELLSLTRTDTNSNVASGVVAPGTFGQFEIELDTTGSEVAMDYSVDVVFTNCPHNMKFYKDSNHQQPYIVNNSIIHIEKYLELEDVDKVQSETIYWEWPYETGSTPEQIELNDEIDSLDQGKTISIQITAKATQAIEETLETMNPLINQISVQNYGDKVNYDLGINALTNDWQIFYKDEDYVYIKYAGYLPNSTQIAFNAGLQTNNEYAVNLESDRNNFARILSDGSKWVSLVRNDLKSKATAFGAVDLQTWVASWNQKHPNEILYLAGDDINGWFVATYNPPESIAKVFLNGIDNLYLPYSSEQAGCYGYWMSSISGMDDVCVICVSCKNTMLYDFYSNGALVFGLSPVVRLSANVLGEYQDGAWNIK